MSTNRAMSLILLVALSSGVALGCTAQSTTPAPTSAPLPTQAPTPTPKPTPQVITASNDPITAGVFTIKISKVVISANGLTVEAILVSGGTLSDLAGAKPWVADESGTRYNSASVVSYGGENTVGWMYLAPQTARSFLWNFPSGEVIDLSPLLTTGS